MKVQLVNNRYKEHTAARAKTLARKLEAFNIEVAMEDGGKGGNPDLIIVLGGDGTILRAVRQYADLNLPLLGVNMGTVGFLSNIEATELDDYLERLIAGDYVLDRRMLLGIDIYHENQLSESFCCLNDLVIRAATPRLVSFNLVIDGQNSGAYRGDGLIIASPTGSTAYSLSAGGPICDPEMGAFIVTPIAPHFISKRPMVISSRRVLELTPLDCQDAVICIDGQIKRDFKEQCSIRVSQAEVKLNLVDLKGASFFNMANRLRRMEGSWL